MSRIIRTKKVGRLVGSLVLVGILALPLLVGGCEPDPTEPEPPPDCERNHTASVAFKNNSDRTTYDVIWDGSRIGTIRPGKSTTRTVSAGRHSMVFRFANTRQNACSSASPSIAQCSSRCFTCDVDR